MKYFFGFLASIALVVVVVILVIRGFSGGGSSNKNQIVLGDYASTEMAVQITVDGRINADQSHQGYHILVDRFGSKIETYKGYENTITQAKTYDGNETAYANFLRALDQAGYAKGDTSSSKADERGICATGQRYVYEIKGGPKGDQRFWGSSCGGGTFKGNANLVRTLFRSQIPDFSLVTGSLQL